MAVSPGTYNVTIQRASDWSVILQFKDSTDTAINLTGYTVYAQAWDKARSTKYADFTVAYTDSSKWQGDDQLDRHTDGNFYRRAVLRRAAGKCQRAA